MVFKRVVSLLVFAFIVTQAVCLAGVQQVKSFEIIQNHVNIENIGCNQCDILLNKKIILIGPSLFSVKDTGKFLYNFFPEGRDLSFFKKVKISPDGKYVGFLCNGTGAKPELHVWRADDDSFARFTKMFITIGCQGDHVVTSFCFTDNEELVLITSLRNITTDLANPIGLLSCDFVESFDDVFVLLDNVMPSQQEEPQNYFFCRNLKNNNYSWTPMVIMDDIIDVDFLRRGPQGVRFVAKRACGEMLWFDSDGEWLDFRESRAHGFEDSKMKFASDNNLFGFLYYSQGFKVWGYAQDGSEVIKFKYKLCDNLQLMSGAYELDSKNSQIGRLALICCRDSKIFYYEYTAKC